MSSLLQETQQPFSVSEVDRIELSNLISRVVSEPDFRALFQSDPAEAIRVSGVTLSQPAADALVRNAKLGADLTVDMDKVASAFFFFFVA